MILRRVVTCALFCCVACASRATAQTTNDYWDMKTRVLNLVFPLDDVPPPYLWKITLRFNNPESQIVAVVHAGGKSEVVRYTLADMNDRELSQLIVQALAENSSATAEEIAAKVRVDVDRRTVRPEVFSRVLKELSRIRISPQTGGTCLGQCPQFDYWYDSGLNSAHYVIRGGDDRGSPQYQLVQWMIRFRTNLPQLEKLNPEPAKSSRP